MKSKFHRDIFGFRFYHPLHLGEMEGRAGIYIPLSSTGRCLCVGQAENMGAEISADDKKKQGWDDEGFCGEFAVYFADNESESERTEIAKFVRWAVHPPHNP